ncbi:MAG: tetratricopeptide repeat protein [Acidobacteria bacterium]|nr:tetratricopeptide repeat protein [Acidobacteriota bacterium]
MAEVDAVSEFKEGLSLLRNNYARKALSYFTRAIELDKTNPFYMSYLGLAMAAGERNWDAGEELCLQAIKMRRTQPELYLNLADVYRLAGKRSEAIEALTQGMTMTKRDARIVEALIRFGRRRQPVIPFLGRDHFINRGLGKLRYRLSRPSQQQSNS